MLRASSLIVAGLAASAIACASHPPSTEVTASDFDLNPLVGEWRGDYSSAQTGRQGTVAFTLRAGESSASGNIVMIPRADSLLSPAERELVTNVSAPGRSVLTIHFVRKEGGNLSGSSRTGILTATARSRRLFRDPFATLARSRERSAPFRPSRDAVSRAGHGKSRG